MTVKIPDSWNEVTVGQYQELCQTSKDLDTVSILLDQDPEEVRKFDSASMGKIVSHLGWVKQLPDDKKYNAFVEVNGKEYRLIENLNSFTLGEWIDMEEYLNDFKTNIHLILAMLYRDRPGYDTEDNRERAELFRDNMMIGDVYGCFVFFSLVAAKSMTTIQHTLLQQTQTRMKHLKKDVKDLLKKKHLKNGVGTLMPTD